MPVTLVNLTVFLFLCRLFINRKLQDEKSFIYLLLLPLVVAVTACGGKVNSKKESVLATQDSVDARGIQRMQTSKSEIDIKFKGKDYRSFVSRTPDETCLMLPMKWGIRIWIIKSCCV